ncbi:MAG TPA: hypothetical protein VKN64_04555 [Halanaerobiales bacterium]|nr:hypothetical protein [Halanaerobiales bacterium]
MFYNFWALVTVVLALLISYYTFRNDIQQKIISFAQLLVWTVSLISLVIGLSNLFEIKVLGSLVSFVILANLYMAVVNIGVRLQKRISRNI